MLKEKCKVVFNKNNFKGIWLFFVLEEFLYVGKDLIGDGFEVRIKIRLEIVKILLFF